MAFVERTAVVTGGSRGIGLAIARKFVQKGMNVAILSTNITNLENAIQVLATENLHCQGIQCDVSELESVKNALSAVCSHFGGIDVVVNSAGLLDMFPVDELTTECWDKIMAVNVRGTFLVSQQSIPYLLKSSAPRIINISSNAGRMGGYENGLAYTASKGAVISLTYGLARRLADKGITVNCIAPGTIASDMSKVYDEAAQKRLISRFPVGRLGTPEEVASAACYFASEESGFTTGAVLDVNGGMFMG